jgi:D-amino-acid dehydrogenase
MLGLNARTLELYDELRDSGVAFEMHSAGLVFAALTAGGMKSVRNQFAMLAESGWGGAVEEWDRQRITAEEPALADNLAGALFAPDQRHVRPESLVRGLLQALRGSGVQIAEHAAVESVTRRNGKWSIAAGGETYSADAAVIAAGVWTSSIVRQLGVRLPVQAAKGYSLTARGSGTSPRHALYLEEVKIGVTPFDDGTRIAGTLELAGIDLDLNTRRMTALVKAAAPYLRDWQPRDPRVEWAGLRPLAPDGLPVIGELPGQDGLYVATGHGTLGVTLSPATAALLAPLVVDGTKSPDLAPFEPARFA